MVCSAIALWVSCGALSFVDAENTAAYVGVLPSPLWLALLLVGGVIGVFVFRPTAQMVAPLWLSAVAILPWLPAPIPLSAFIWSGNMLLWLWTTIGVVMLAPAMAGAGHSIARLPPRTAVLGAGGVTALLLGAATWSVAPAHPDADEPHYLVITQSLLSDHDLAIENNHARGDYQAYIDRSIKPDFLKRGLDGRIYSIHAPGLPLIVAPGFALLGYPGVLLELILLSAVASGLFWYIAWRATGDAAASWFGWAVFALTVPFFFHASAVFPDGMAAVLTIPAVLALVDPRAREPRWLFAVGVALAILPWLNSRFVLLSVMAALVIGGRLVTDRGQLVRRVTAFAICPAVSAVGFFLFFQLIYGTPNPSVVYGGVPTMSTSPATLVRGVPGLFFDQQFGLIPNAPVYICAFAGLVLMKLRGSSRLAAELTLIAVPYFLVAASFTSWWGGTTAPARYFAPIAALLALPAAFWFAHAKSVAARTASIGTLVLSLLTTVTIAIAGRGALVFNVRDGISRVARWLSPVVDLTTALPSLFQNPPGMALLHAAAWLTAIAAAAGAAALVARRGRTTAATAFGLALEVAAMLVVSLVWRTNHATVATPNAGGPVVLRFLDSTPRPLTLAYRPFRRLNPDELPGRIVLARTLSTIPRRESVSLLGVPAGVYEIAGITTGATTGRVRIRTDRVSGPLADWDAATLESSWTRRVTLPVAVASLQFEVDAAARKTIRDVSVRAISVAPPGDALEHRQARRGARFGPATIFLMDGTAWVEPAGVWIGAGAGAGFAVALDAQAPLQLLVRNGPVENVVTLESGAWRAVLMLQKDQEQLIPIPTISGRPTTPLHVSASSGFRPSDVEPKSDDRRLLGVWVTTR